MRAHPFVIVRVLGFRWIAADDRDASIARHAFPVERRLRVRENRVRERVSAKIAERRAELMHTDTVVPASTRSGRDFAEGVESRRRAASQSLDAIA